MTTIDQSLKARLAAATVNAGGSYVNANTRGIVDVVGIRIRDGFKGQSLIVDLQVVESQGKAAGDGFAEGKAHKVGDRFSRVMKLNEGDKVKASMNLGDVLQTLQAINNSLEIAAGASPTQYDSSKAGDDLAVAVDETNPFGGIRLSYDTRTKLDKNNKVASYLTLSAGPNNTEAELNERRKAMGLK